MVVALAFAAPEWQDKIRLIHRLTQRLKITLRTLIVGPQVQQLRRDLPAISPAEIAEVKAFFPLEKYFIFGHARSGTTLLARLVRVHPQVYCNWQAHFFTRPPLLQSLAHDPEVRTWLVRPSNRWNRGQDLTPLVLRAAADFILERDARQAGKAASTCIVGDKSPNSLLDGEAVRLMAKVYPDARLVYIVRDGRDVVLSHRFQTFIDRADSLPPEDARLRQAFIKDPEPFLSGKRSVFTEQGLTRAVEAWVRNVAETDQAGKTLYGERYHCLIYENLLQDPEAEMRRLWEFLGADCTLPGLGEALAAEMSQNPDAEWQAQKAGEIATALRKGKHGSWREMFTERDRHIFHRLGDETLRRWGYSA